MYLFLYKQWPYQHIKNVHISLSYDKHDGKIINMIYGHEDLDQLERPSNVFHPPNMHSLRCSKVISFNIRPFSFKISVLPICGLHLPLHCMLCRYF